jgi:ABC-type phosphate/phosphonate transport system ATPase subunit
LPLINAAGVAVRGQHKAFFDNYFTSEKLLKHLVSIEICATGTVQENRAEKCPLKSKQVRKKGEKMGFISEAVVMYSWLAGMTTVLLLQVPVMNT